MQKYLSLIKFSHTIFAMPFAVVGFILGTLGTTGQFNPILFLQVLLCMVFARSAAMAFNRYLDREIDKKNPRTVTREIPSGQLSEKSVLLFTWVNVLLFIVVAYTINPLCFYLSPVALLIILGYSYTKRFTSLCHLVLGVGLALAPVGAYIAVTGNFHFIPVLLGFSVLFWVSGFDIIYALQDEDFDRDSHLNSMPALLGRKTALFLARGLHTISALFLILFVGFSSDYSPVFSLFIWLGAMVFIVMLIYQHLIISPKDLSRIGLAFFTFNGIASIVFSVFFILDSFWI